MLNHRQRMILEEAAKHGGANISVPEQMARAINESDDKAKFKVGDRVALASHPNRTGKVVKVTWWHYQTIEKHNQAVKKQEGKMMVKPLMSKRIEIPYSHYRYQIWFDYGNALECPEERLIPTGVKEQVEINEAKTTMSFDEIVAEIKSSLKATFPKHTFSVRKGMATYTPRLRVILIAGPTAFNYEPDGTPSKNAQVTHHQILPTHLYKQGKEFFDKVEAIVTKRHWDESDAQVDYFRTNFYYSIGQGDIFKPFVLTDASGKKPLDPTQTIRKSAAWQGKTEQIRSRHTGGNTLVVVADNLTGYAKVFATEKTAQAFSDKYKLGGVYPSHYRRNVFYVLVNPAVKEEVDLVSEAVEYKINDPRLVKAARDALPPKHSTNPQTVTKMAQVMWHMWADSDGTIKIGELARLARVRLGINEEVDVDESVSMPRDQRIARVKQNQDKIDRIKAYIAAKGLPLELQDTVGKRLPWLTTYNQRLGTEEWLKRSPSAWVNQEGLYVGREIDRIINVLKHHGIAIPHLESVDEDGEEITEYYRRAGFRSSSYSGDPRWITAKYAGVDAHGKPFKKGEKVLYFPNGKKFYTGPEAEKAWLEFLSAKGDEEGMPFAM